MQFERQFYGNQTKEWTEKYCDFGTLDHTVRQIKKDQSRAPLSQSSSEPLFLQSIVYELEKVSLFYTQKLEEYKSRYEKLKLIGAYKVRLPSFYQQIASNTVDSFFFFTYPHQKLTSGIF